MFPEPTREFRVEVDLVAEMAVLNPFDFFLEPYAEQVPFQYEATEALELAPYPGARRRQYAAVRAVSGGHSARQDQRTIDFLVALNRRVAGDIRYLIRMEPGVQTPEQTLERAAGSCRDSAWLLVQLLRHLGLAARFVSGYLIQLKADVKSLDGPSGPPRTSPTCTPGARSICPGRAGSGWIRPRGCWPGEGHIPLACTPEPSSAAPISGAVEECEVQFEHHMSVARIWEAPRVTKPYTEAQWQADRVPGLPGGSTELERGDVRLTMGGEPTFVSIDDPDGAEWNTAALGRASARLAARALIIACATAMRRRAWRTSARASGIRASRCRAGR